MRTYHGHSTWQDENMCQQTCSSMISTSKRCKVLMMIMAEILHIMYYFRRAHGVFSGQKWHTRRTWYKNKIITTILHAHHQIIIYLHRQQPFRTLFCSSSQAAPAQKAVVKQIIIFNQKIIQSPCTVDTTHFLVFYRCTDIHYYTIIIFCVLEKTRQSSF